MVSPALISASSAPDTRPLKSWDTKFPQFSIPIPHPSSRRDGRVASLPIEWNCGPPPPTGSAQPRLRFWLLPPLRRGGMAMVGGAEPRTRGLALCCVAQLAAERRRVLHDAIARHDLDDIVEIVLALHI